MPTYVILAAMKGRFVSDFGNTYDNFQMMGYVTLPQGETPFDAVAAFFDQPPYPIPVAGRRIPLGRTVGGDTGQRPLRRLRPRLCRVTAGAMGARYALTLILS